MIPTLEHKDNLLLLLESTPTTIKCFDLQLQKERRSIQSVEQTKCNFINTIMIMMLEAMPHALSMLCSHVPHHTIRITLTLICVGMEKQR